MVDFPEADKPVSQMTRPPCPLRSSDGADPVLKHVSFVAERFGNDIAKANKALGTSYASFAVGYAGAPEDLYANLKAGIGLSQGLKAVDLSNTTINLEVTGQMNLVTTMRSVQSTTTVETQTTEERRVEPINPSPPQN